MAKDAMMQTDRHTSEQDMKELEEWVASQGKLLRMRATVSGKVQGVVFRYFASIAAHKLNVTGWVRNLRDGSVQVEAQGSQQALFAMYEKLCEGPEWSRVMHVDVTNIPVLRGERTFRVEYDE